MVFSINPTANKTQEMFEQMAIAQNGTGTTAAIVATSSASVAVNTMMANTMTNSMAYSMTSAMNTMATAMVLGSPVQVKPAHAHASVVLHNILHPSRVSRALVACQVGLESILHPMKLLTFTPGSMPMKMS